MQKEQSMKEALSEIKGYFKNWLLQSNLTNDAFLDFRTCKRYSLNVKECMQDEKEGIAVFITHGADSTPIGLPFWIGYDNSTTEKEQFFLNTSLLLIYMAGQLDKANKDMPINGSYINGYFMLKTKAFLPRFMERKDAFLSA